jgi:FtsP/CotA-like multicopper oxidase with cupredoxin domain
MKTLCPIAASAVLGLTLLASSAHAEIRETTLTAAAITWEITPSQRVVAWAYNGTVPGPVIRAISGDTIRVTLVNKLAEATTIHWHGVPVPNGMDGVPGITAPVVPPGGSFVYEFPAPATGTYWYHPHHDSAAQIARGLYGLLIVDPPEKRWDREVPLVIGEFGMAGAMNRTRGMGGMGGGMGSAMMAGTLLINGKTAPAIPELRVKKGERVLFRMVNTGNMVHPMHVHGMHWEIVATDGFALNQTYAKDTLPLNAGERYDGLLAADNPGRWLVHCHNLEHVGESGLSMTGLAFELVVEE